MGLIKVEATLTEEKGGPRKIEVEYDFGGNLEGAEDMFGGDVVYNNFVAQAKISLQAKLRALMTPDNDGNSLTDEQIAKALEDWTPASKVLQRKSKVEKNLDLLDKLSEGEQDEFLAKARELMEKRASAQAAA